MLSFALVLALSGTPDAKRVEGSADYTRTLKLVLEHNVAAHGKLPGFPNCKR